MRKNKFIFLIFFIICRIVHSDNWNLKLSEGIKERNIEKVKDAIKNGANPNEKGDLTYHPLIWATMNGDTEIVKFLIESGADINIKTEKTNFTLLHIAGIYGRKDICIILIKKGLDVNAKDFKGMTPLIAASYFGHYEVAKLLIKNGADIGIKDSNGETALHKAAEYGRLKICKLLIKKGAKIDLKNHDGDTPLMKAAENAKLDICKLLISKGANIKEYNKQGWTALGLAEKKLWKIKYEFEVSDSKLCEEYTKVVKYLEKKSKNKYYIKRY